MILDRDKALLNLDISRKSMFLACKKNRPFRLVFRVKAHLVKNRIKLRVHCIYIIILSFIYLIFLFKKKIFAQAFCERRLIERTLERFHD